jgi:hypothetical protein
MSAFLADEGLADTIFQSLDQMDFTNHVIGLFDNAATCSVDTVLADLNEASFDGYSNQSLGTPTFGGVIAHVQTTSYPTKTFTAGAGLSGPVTIFGYFVYNTVAGTVNWSENFTTPIVLAVPGDTIQINPFFSFSDQSI